MSVLVIQIPARARLAAQRPDTPATTAAGRADGLAWVLSADGVHAESTGLAQPALLPKADTVVAVLADADVGWQRITLPRAPAAKLRAALGGLLEDRLLEDDDALHLGLAPGSAAGEPAWVAVVDKAWLKREIAAIEQHGPTVDRVVPSSWPGDAPQGHFFAAPDTPADAAPMLAFADADGATVLGLNGSLARAWLPRMTAQPTRWTATPPVAAPAERWLGSTVTVLTDGERALQATRSLWNLRQFDLAPTRRGARALRDAWRRWLSPAWRPARLGLAGLAAVQLLGINLWAWQQRLAIAERRQAQEALLRATFPGVRAVIDAPLQLEREAALLRAAAGRAGDDDLESLLGAAASAWPDGQGPLQTLRFEPGRLTIGAPGWSEPQVQQFRDRLRRAGLAVEAADGRLTIARAPRTGGPA